MKDKTTILGIIKLANEGNDLAQEYLEENKEDFLRGYPELSTDGVWWFWNYKCIGRLTIDTDRGELSQEFEHGKIRG